ncbi:hypothetical protein HYX16_01545 [Candidatus Woesearchaeota archaeon]|nr:hypothetical protein [Candidatus Woesearchaeota archaeon]
MAKYEIKCNNPGLARTIYHRLIPKYQARTDPKHNTDGISVEGSFLRLDERFFGRLEKLTEKYTAKFSKPRKIE